LVHTLTPVEGWWGRQRPAGRKVSRQRHGKASQLRFEGSGVQCNRIL